jgi:hypothetical protein
MVWCWTRQKESRGGCGFLSNLRVSWLDCSFLVGLQLDCILDCCFLLVRVSEYFHGSFSHSHTQSLSLSSLPPSPPGRLFASAHRLSRAAAAVRSPRRSAIGRIRHVWSDEAVIYPPKISEYFKSLHFSNTQHTSRVEYHRNFSVFARKL